MTQTNKVQLILNKVYEDVLFESHEKTKWEIVGCRFAVISGNNGPRWIVPIDQSFGNNVLSQWQPYGYSSLIKWYIIRLLYRFGGISKIPGIYECSHVVLNNLNLPKQHKKIVPVIYVGTPGSQQKAVVTLVDTKDCKSIAVMKVALGENARISLLHEAKILRSLSELDVKNVPLLLSCDENSGRTWQSLVTGKLSLRKLTRYHINWLLDLPSSSKTTSFDEQNVILNQLLEKEAGNFSKGQLKILTTSINTIKGHNQIPLVLVHGDFVPWNLKQCSTKKLAAIDWEDAILEGLPLWDLCHFYFIQAYLFHEKNSILQFVSSPLIKRYLEVLNIKNNDQYLLILLYLLFMILNKNRNYEYKNYLITIISSLSIE